MKNKYSFIAFVIVLFSIFFSKYNRHQSLDSTNPYPIGYDVYGYYLYLPATFIYHDLGLEKKAWQDSLKVKYATSETNYQVADGKDGKRVAVYDPGYAFIWLPGFLIAHWVAPSQGFEADGLSKPYQLSLVITALLFSIIGLILIRKICLHFYSDKISALLLLIIGFGTNYFFEAAYNSTMPHNFLFTINCFIIWNSIRWHTDFKLKNSVGLAFFLALGFLCRATELIWILFPMFWNVFDMSSLKEKINLVKDHKKQVFLFLLTLLAMISIRFIYLHWASGNAFKLNYHTERLTFLDPFTFKFLFSFRKGWLIYTPMMIFAIIGFYHLKKQNKTIWLSCFLFFLINLYVVSSWECWWYAASFGQRPMVETYCILVLPAGAFFTHVFSQNKIWLKTLIVFLLSIFLFLNLFQTWQLMHGVIHPERMTKKYYMETFGQTKFKPEFYQYLSVDHSQSVFTEYDTYQTNYTRTDSSVLDFEKEQWTILNKKLINNKNIFGEKSLLMNGSEAAEFSSAFNKKYSDITPKSYFWLRASVWVYLIQPFNESKSFLVATTLSKERSTNYTTSGNALENVPLYTWTKIHIDLMSPDIKHSDDRLSVYYWNPGQKSVIIDNLQIELFEPKIDYE